MTMDFGPIPPDYIPGFGRGAKPIKGGVTATDVAALGLNSKKRKNDVNDDNADDEGIFAIQKEHSNADDIEADDIYAEIEAQLASRHSRKRQRMREARKEEAQKEQQNYLFQTSEIKMQIEDQQTKEKKENSGGNLSGSSTAWWNEIPDAGRHL